MHLIVHLKSNVCYMLEDSGALGKMLLNNPDLCSDLHSLVCFEMNLMSEFSKV